MSVNIDYAPVRETGNGSKVAFDFTFKIFNASDLVVGKILNSTGVETLLVLNTGYTVVINTVTEGGTVTYAVAPTALQDSFIRREMDITQEADIPTNNLFREVQIENALDKGTMIDQQQQVEIDRSLKIGEAVVGVTVVLPDADAGKALLWNATATALENSTNDFDDIVTDAEAAQVAAEAAESNAAASQGVASAAAVAAAAAQVAAEAAQVAAEAAQAMTDPSLVAINTQTDSYTLVLADENKLIDMNKGSACTLTVPKNSSVAFSVGTIIAARQKGAGQVTIAPVDGDVTINAAVGLKITAQYGMAAIIKIATDVWAASGLLEA